MVSRTARTTARVAGAAAALASALTLVPSTPASAQLVDFSQAPTVWFDQGTWYTTNGCCEVADTLEFGTTGDIPTVGETSGPAVWRPSDQKFRIDVDFDGLTDFAVKYGAATDIPFTGRVGSYAPSVAANEFAGGIGVWRPSDKTFRFDWNMDGKTDRSLRYGTDGDVPFTGDFNNDGRGDVAVWRPSDGRWRIDWNLDGKTDRTIVYGTNGDTPLLTIDFSLDGGARMVIGVHRPSDGKARFDTNLNGVTDATQTFDPAVIDTLGAATAQLVIPYIAETTARSAERPPFPRIDLLQ